jgi:uncharacterized membrane protein YdjX (TVP38/TMEM64 family)
MPDTRDAPERDAPSWRRFVPVAILLAALAAVYLTGVHERVSLDAVAADYRALRAWIEAHPIVSGLAFTAFYALAVTVSLPGALWFTIAGGLLFGLPFGALYSWIGATTGATLVFLAARTALRGVLRARVGSRLERFKAGFERGAFGYLVVCRMVPLPFFLVNVAPAFFEVRPRTFVAATALGVIPATAAYAALGAGAGEAVAAGRGLDVSLLGDPTLVAAFLALAALAVAGVLLQSVRARLERRS